MGRKLSLLERVMVFIITFFIVVFVLSHFRIWQLELQAYFIKAERWLELVFIFTVVTAITMVLIKLLQWEYEIESGQRPLPRRK